ncbi:MAG: DUF5309 family protein [Gammaproteobacteria bacterium]|nr:DUF5309 family protein [Gammaproteobacteria bacterium]
MPNPADEWSGADLDGVARDGLINEDVMQAIWDISNVPLPFHDRAGTMSVSNSYHSWTQDTLATPDLTNAAIDGADLTANDATGGARVGNHCQISTKRVSVTTRARNSGTIGRADELAYQVARRQIELRRDREAIVLENQASVADDGDTVAGKLGGLPTWMETNIDLGATGTAGGYNTADGLTDVYTAGTTAAISEATIRDLVESVYNEGGESQVLMSVPKAIRLISEYMFTDTAKIATLQSDQSRSRDPAAALGTVNYFITDFGSLELVPNRLQQYVDTNDAEIHILDFQYLRLSYLHGYKVEPVAKTGLADKRIMSVDGSLAVLNEKAQALYADVLTNTAMVA